MHDYELLKAVAARSVFGDADKIERLDLAGLEDDIQEGKYGPLKDYYSAFVDGTDRPDQIKNALHDLNIYLSALRDFEKHNGSLANLAAVKFHQTNYVIDRVIFEYKQSPASNLVA